MIFLAFRASYASWRDSVRSKIQAIVANTYQKEGEDDTAHEEPFWHFEADQLERFRYWACPAVRRQHRYRREDIKAVDQERLNDQDIEPHISAMEHSLSSGT